MSSAAAGDAVLLTIAEDIAEIRFNRPKVLNAVNVETATALLEAIGKVRAVPGVRVVVLSGEGRGFMAGGDLAYFRAAGVQAGEAARVLVGVMHEAIEALARLDQPVLASLQGPVAGAGMSLAMAADLAIAADNAVFNLAYLKIGNSPDSSATWTLPRLVGLRKAFEIALLSDNIEAQEALRLGLVNRVVPAERLAEETRALGRRLAATAPLALASTKRLLRDSSVRSLHEQLDAEAVNWERNADSADFREALAAFFEKRAPHYAGR